MAQDEAEEGTTFSLFVEARLGMGPAKAPQATAGRGHAVRECLLPAALQKARVWSGRPVPAW